MDRDQLVVLITQLVSGGSTIEGALRQLRMLPLDEQTVFAAAAEYETRVRRIRSLKAPRALEDPDVQGPWYGGPKEGDLFWPAVRANLLDSGISADAVGRIDDASSKIVSYLAPPGAASIGTRGLVLGHVQSGKTTSFMSVVAKAADAGYRVFVVLSGIHNSLRWQTQQRMNAQLVHPVEAQWFKLTEEHDFRSPGNANFLLGDPDKKLIAVVKKNPSRLRALNRWLNGAAPETMRNCPMLVIDDEADQASIDVGTEEQRSKINELILELLAGPEGRPRKAAYVGYTATPFANLLIDPAFEKDLYPRDFIVDLEKPEGHFGTEVIFGRERRTPEEEESVTEGHDVVRIVPEEEVADLRPPARREARASWEPRVTDSLADGLRWFCLATAARRARGGGGNPHSTMLIHTTVLTDAQEGFRDPVRAFLDGLREGVAGGREDVVGGMRALWEEEQRRLPSDVVDQSPVPFAGLLPELGGVLDDVEVVIDNYRSESRLSYPDVDGGPRTVVVVGGNTLSRGLTLEGLVCSFFVRTASAYDTLLQMGRWFGYRRGYEDLPRIWMTAQLREWFIWLATVEHEVRLDIARYEAEKVTPTEFAVRIATHPQMAVTSALKMRDAVQAKVSYGGRRIQTILFHHRDARWLSGNLETARALVGAAISGGAAPGELGNGRVLLGDVPVAAVRDFLARYEFHENSRDLQRKPLLAYLAARNRLEELVRWNVVVMGSDNAALGTLGLGLPAPVGMINRSRLDIPGLPHANIKSLMSKVDRVADLGLPATETADLDEEELQRKRPPGVGLLLLYPISKDSVPGGTARGRQPRVGLDAVEHVIGVGLVFPDVKEDSAQSYVSAPLPDFEEEELKVDLDAVDGGDAAGQAPT